MNAVVALEERDPCGERESAVALFAANELYLSDVKVPVLLAYGEQDRLIIWPYSANQAKHFSGSDDVTVMSFPGTGHALPPERTAPTLLDPTLADWLAARGF